MTSPRDGPLEWNPPWRENNLERDPQRASSKGAPQGRNSQEENFQKGFLRRTLQKEYMLRGEISLGKNTSGRDPQIIILQKGYFEDKSNS